ncbi:hypothetical protein [Aeromonas sp. FDAARGOS 1404]|uniref:hypothetical protein n=1 Tax=Aeromonas TaxID=642 RepID=UPI001C22C8ED|nr:hypothetical protein [Aeromonas sp. FDAARGOS 1404]QWZ84822.1 hypothetical protein I6L34_18970 [Aeromonas sp. FDAARGOS 1404]
MKCNKDASIRVRIDSDVEAKLKTLCEFDNTNPSVVIRRLVDAYVNLHPQRNSMLNITFKITKLPEENPHSWYMFIIEATLQSNIVGYDLDSVEIPFLLPEFFDDMREPFRVDSVYYHRMSFPNCIGEKGRFIGAKMVGCKWKGAIYVYKDSLLETPEVYEDMVKDALDNKIKFGVSQYIRHQCYTDLEINVAEEIFESDLDVEHY